MNVVGPVVFLPPFLLPFYINYISLFNTLLSHDPLPVTSHKLSACSMYVFAILELCEVDQRDNLVNLVDGKQCIKTITLCLDFRLSAAKPLKIFYVFKNI